MRDLGSSIDRPLWRLVWPVAVMGWLRTGYLLTDAWFVGWLGDDALAAIGGCAFAWWIILLMTDLGAIGVHTLVAQQVGAGRADQIGSTLAQGAWLGAIVSVALLFLVPAVPLYLDAVGFLAGSPTEAFGGQYLVACLLGSSALMLQGLVSAVFKGLGDTRAALEITALGFVVNAVLDPVLLYQMGIAGAAWATVAAAATSALFGLWRLGRRGIHPRGSRPDRARILEIARIGAPVSARGVAFCLVYVVLGRMILSHGVNAMAGLAIGHRVEGLAYQVCVAFEVAAATLVGQAIGAGDLASARRAADRAAGWCVAAMVPATALAFLLAPTVFPWFGVSTETAEAGTLYLRIQSLVFVFMALESVYGGAFAGVANTVPPFWIVAIGTLLRLPVAVGLASGLGWGVSGIWWAISLSTLGKGVVSAWWFRRRRWTAGPNVGGTANG